MSDDRELNVSVNDDDDSHTKSHLQYRRLRAPAGSGESLQIPPLRQTVAKWKENNGWSTPKAQIGDVDLATLKQQGRAELLKSATEYTRQYCDVDLKDRDARSIVMSGHQPQLFHPGVWFKNFALSSLGSAVNAIPVNLVVDNDVCGPASIKCPVYKSGKASTRLVQLDDSHPTVPFEVRPIVDDKLFDNFPDRLCEQASTCFALFQEPAMPLVWELWQHVDSVRQSMGASASLGTVLAAGRHRIERVAGLATLEVPISVVATTKTFARFAAGIVSEQQRFNQAYNSRLREYRQLHKIRSNAHPVPELQTVGSWMESPFWIWTRERPARLPLFVRHVGKEIEFSDRNGWEFLAPMSSLAEAWHGLSDSGVSLRPRALITTLFCRLIMSDRFLHGIGGAKYDQLTDLIAKDFVGSKPPPFSTMTATFRLPVDHPIIDRSNESELRQQIRKRRFHPERFLDPTGSARELIARKRSLIDDTRMPRIDWHHEIERANELLQPFVDDEIQKLTEDLNQVSANRQNSRILSSREYSFCLFGESLIEDLKRLSDVDKKLQIKG